MRRSQVGGMFLLAAGLGAFSAVAAPPDNIYRALSKDLAIGTLGIAGATGTPGFNTFGYDPINDVLYIANSGTITTTTKDIRKVEHFSDPSQQVATRLVANYPEWYKWTRYNNTDNGGGNAVPFGILLNPKPIGSKPAYSTALIFDSAAVVTSGSPTVNHPEWTARFYQYDLQVDSNNDPSDNFTTVVTLQDIKTAHGGLSDGSNSMGSARMYAWSGDGQSVYWMDQGNGVSAYGGLWKASASGSVAPKRLITGTFGAAGSSELAVVSNGSVDTMYMTGHGTNVGGLDKVTHDGVNTSTFTTAVSPQTMADFLEVPTSTLAARSLAADNDGNVYFTNITAGAGTLDRRGTYRLDPQGRLSRVASYADRVELAVDLAMSDTTPQADTFRLQVWNGTFTNGSGSFSAPRVLFPDSDGDMVVGLWAFKPGDFNRDNQVNQADIPAFKAALTPRAAHTIVTSANRKFDMNGNEEITWKDVKILQSFYPFLDGDANIDLSVDSLDFDALVAAYGKLSGGIWTQGDFTGDDKVTTLDFNLLAGNFGLTPPSPGSSLGIVVPEPASFAAIAMGTLLFARRKRT